MAIINHEKFIGLIYIDLEIRDDRNTLNVNYCPFVEKKMLTKLMGETLYNDFKNNTTVTKYANLINGVSTTYEYNGKNKVYTGLKDMLAYFTWFYYVSDQQTFNSQVGQVQPKVQNATIVNPAGKYAMIWNEAVELYYQAIDYINYINSVTPDTYDDFLYEDIDKINQFGI